MNSATLGVFKPLELPVARAVLREREQWWMDSLGAATYGYNVCPFTGTTRGREPSELERRRRIEKGAPVWLNTADAIKKRVSTRLASGSGMKLTRQSAEEIRAAYGDPTRNGAGRSRSAARPTMKGLATQHGVSAAAIHSVIWGVSWK